MTTTITYSVRNPSDDTETSAWTCETSSSVGAAHQYLAEFWSAEQREDGSWYSPTYTGDIDGADLSISIDRATTAYLAVYTGPNGPISATFEAENLSAALAVFAERRQEWYDDAEDYLGNPPGASDEAIDATLDEGRWELVRSLGDGWRLYA